MNFIRTQDIQHPAVQETTVRDNPALRVTFDNSPGLVAHFIADPGDDYWQSQIIFILEKGTDNAFQDYVEGGQGNYGSDCVVRDSEGDLRFDGLLENSWTSKDMAEIVAAGWEDIQDTGDDPLFVTAEATSTQQEVLKAVSATDEGRAFFDQHVAA